jgi:hypothetical protein
MRIALRFRVGVDSSFDRTRTFNVTGRMLESATTQPASQTDSSPLTASDPDLCARIAVEKDGALAFASVSV